MSGLSMQALFGASNKKFSLTCVRTLNRSEKIFFTCAATNASNNRSIGNSNA